MSPASYRTAPPRVADDHSTWSVKGGSNRDSAEEVERLRDLDAGAVAEPDPVGTSAVGLCPVCGGEVALGLRQQRLGPGHLALAGVVVSAVGSAVVAAVGSAV